MKQTKCVMASRNVDASIVHFSNRPEYGEKKKRRRNLRTYECIEEQNKEENSFFKRIQ